VEKTREERAETNGAPAKPRYDCDLLRHDAERLLAAYLNAPGKVSGTRLLWTCPRCGKEKLYLQRAKGVVGCMNAACEVPEKADVIEVVAHLEGRSTRGEDFLRVCALSYQLLGFPDPLPEVPEPAAAIAEATGASQPIEEPASQPDPEPAAKTGPGEDAAGEVSQAEREEPGGEAAESGREEATLADPSERWYAVLDRRPGATALVAAPAIYRPATENDEQILSAGFAEAPEIEWSVVLGLIAATLFWLAVWLLDGWVMGRLPRLPEPPAVLVAWAGIPSALGFGLLVAAVTLLHLRGRRLAERDHLLGRNKK
jgi:hypothetical protein